MSGTISIDGAISGSHGPWYFDWQSTKDFIQSGRGMEANLRYLTTTPEELSFGEVVAPGVAILHNIGDADADWILWGPACDCGGYYSDPVMAGPFILQPGEFAIVHLAPGTRIMAQAATSTAILQPYFFEE